MLKSNIGYSKEFEECEQEELRKTGAVQQQFNVLIFKQGKLIATNHGLDVEVRNEAKSIFNTPRSPIPGSSHHIADAKSLGRWLHHHHNGYDIFEIGTTLCEFNPITENEVQALVKSELANVWKLAGRTCQLLSEKTKAERVMVYQFHEDWSGEVIAERVMGHAESFLGLRYPPTDIPKIARVLYMETRTRHLFSLNSPVDIVSLTGADIKDIDLSHCLSRSVSPFHIEYLKNMGSQSTQACAIILNGQLWGLISIHFSSSRSASIDEYVYFQSFIHLVSPLFTRVIQKEKELLEKQSSRAVSRLMDNVSDELEPFNTILLSDIALHKIVGAQGISLIIDSEIANVGNVPKIEAIQAIADEIRQNYKQGFYFWDQSPFYQTLSNQIAGIALHYLCAKPFTCVIVYRKMLNQTICWGGDPRLAAQKSNDSLRYSPRKSFKRWVENVEGQSVPWSNAHQKAFKNAFDSINAFLEVDNCELAILLRNGMRRTLKKREKLRSFASSVIDNITSGIAIGIEQGNTNDSEIVAINNVTAESFNVSHTDLIGITLTELTNLLGIEGIQETDNDFLTIKTTNIGVRDVELHQALLFEYFDFSEGKFKKVRLKMYEFLDITESTRIQKSLQAARDRAVSENKLRNEMVAKLMHELKTPLNGLVGLSDLLRRRPLSESDPQSAKLIESLHQTAQLMKDVVEYTLKSSALVDTVDIRNFRSIPLMALLNDIIQMVQPLADNKQVNIELNCDNISIFAEPRGIRQILINVIENAIKYNDVGGSVVVTAVALQYGRVSITITDTGAGMTQEQVKKCTEPYQRFSNLEGSGLGLPIAESLVRNMGGQFEITSSLGVGTTITISLSVEGTDAATL